PQHLHPCTGPAGQGLLPQESARRLLRRPDHRGGGLRRIHGRWTVGGSCGGRAAAGHSLRSAAGGNRARSALPPRQRRGASAGLRLPAEQHQLEPLSPARGTGEERGAPGAHGRSRAARSGGLDRRERGARRETSGGDAVRIGYGLLVVALALAACKKAEPPPYQGKGRAIYRGPAREVIVAPDGGAIGWIADPVQAKEKGTNAPDHVYVGRATYDTGSGDPVTLGDGVATTTKVGTFFFSPTGDHVGALTEWSFAHGEGTLVVGSTRGKGVRRVAPKVSFFAFSRDGKWLGYVSDGKFLVEPADGGQPVELTAEVATFEFSPDSQWVLARKRSVVGGQLVLARRDGAEPARPLASRVNEYKWSPDGRRIAYTTRGEEGGSDLFVLDINGTARRVGKGVPTFAFSPRAKHLAFIGDTSP